MTPLTIYATGNKEKWVITQNENGLYDVEYFEYFKNGGWRSYGNKETNYTKEAIEWDFDIELI